MTLAGGGGGGAGKVALLGEQDAEAAAGGGARDPGAIDAASDHQQIDLGGEHASQPPRALLKRSRWAM